MFLNEYVKEELGKIIKAKGSLRKAASSLNIHPSMLSKIMNGKYMPTKKRLIKLLPEIVNMDFEDEQRPINITKVDININCKDIDELKNQLNSIGYDIDFVITKIRQP